jgi:hypothetical protein
MPSDVAEIARTLTKAEQEECLKGRGHVTRFSDSSLYDEKCILCGAVDGMPTLGFPDTLTTTDCQPGLAVRDYLKGQEDD